MTGSDPIAPARPAARGADGDVGAIVQAEWAGLVALLVRRGGDLQAAEDAVQDAAEAALAQWPVEGLPDKPGAWLTTVATRRLVDRQRRERRRTEVERTGAHWAGRGRPGDRAAAPHTSAPSTSDPTTSDLATTATTATTAAVAVEAPAGEVDAPAEDDDVLRLLLLCCHPALAPEHQVALTLRAVGGLATPEIARAFLVPEATMAQRIVRAKRKIEAARIPFRLPGPDDLDERLDAVRRVIYLVFNEGYCSSSGTDAIRLDLCEEALTLGRLLLRLHPDTESAGLVALLAILHARHGARTSPDGDLVLLDDQDRDVWDRRLLSDARQLLDVTSRTRAAHPDPTPAGPYELQARIAAVHGFAPSADRTDWSAVVALYDALLVVAPTPVARLNRAVAVARADGPDAGLRALDDLAHHEDRASLDGYHLLHATEGWLLATAGRTGEAIAAYERALATTANPAEQRLLRQRIDALGA